MKTVVIYQSQTGFTKQYAECIAEKTQADIICFKEAKNKDFSSYDTIAFGSWCCAGGLQKLKWFKERMSQWNDKKLVVFAVGASPVENPDVETSLHNMFTDEEREIVKAFYCPGGLRYDKMTASSRLLMKMFAKALQSKKNKTDEEMHTANMLGKSYDISDQKYIEPIVEFIIGK